MSRPNFRAVIKGWANKIADTKYMIFPDAHPPPPLYFMTGSLTENIQPDVELPQLKLKHNNQMNMASHDDLVNESRKL